MSHSRWRSLGGEVAVRWSERRRSGTAASRWPHASGEQWTITEGANSATLVSVGGGIRSFDINGTAVLAKYSPDEISPAAAGQILAPWPNRIGDGRYTFEGQTHQLAINEPERNTAIHGLVRWLVWELVTRLDNEVTIACQLPPQPGYPWPLELSTRWTVSADGLRATHTVSNIGEQTCPFGIGIHPYLRFNTATGLVQAPATRWLRVDERMLPIEELPVAGTPYDFRHPRPVGNSFLDTAFTGLLYGADGTARTRLTTTAHGTGVEVWQDASFPWLQLYTGPGPTGSAGETLAVEPMTCPPDAFRTGVDLVKLAPGEQWSGTWGIRPYA